MASANVHYSEQVRKFERSIHTLRTNVAANEEEGLTTPLLADGPLDDFLTNDPQDTIFEEYDSSTPSETPLDLNSWRPSVLKSVVDSASVVLQAILLGGIVLGIVGVMCFYIDLNTATYCHWVPSEMLQKLGKSVRVAGQALEGFVIQFWQFLILWFIFKWPLMKELNLLTITVLVAFVDALYRLILHVFQGYKPPWIPYPLNVLFTFNILYTSYAVGRRKFPDSKSKALTLAFKLCAQFIVDTPISYLLNYLVFPWFARTQPGFERMIVATIAPMIMIPGKVISRLCAIQLRGVNHPGTSHAIVSGAYGAPSIIFRTLQAGMENFWLFTALSIGHGVFYIIERLTVPLRDHYWNKLGLSFCCCCSHQCRMCRDQSNLRSPRYQRLTGDISIQGMLFESMAIVFSISVVYVYYMAYGISLNKWAVFRVEVTRRILVALAVEFVFNSIAVLFQVHYMNIPVIRVWRRKWKKHLTLAFITTTISVVYYSEYMLQFIRELYEKDEDFPITNNCTKPFHFAP